MTLMVAAMAGCGSSLDVSTTQTACITPGQPVTLHVHTLPSTQLTWSVQDDFTGDLAPAIPAQTTDSGGNATTTWQSPGQLSTTTLHFLLVAVNGDQRANRDIHVVVGGNGRQC